MKEITFDNLPKAMELLLEKIDSLSQEIRQLKQPVKDEQYLTLQEAADFLGVSKSALRQNKSIPAIERMRKLYFKKSDLISYMESGLKTPKPKKVFEMKN